MMKEEQERRVCILERERDYLKEKYEEVEEENKRVLGKIRENELEDNVLRKTLEEKIKRLEE